MNHRIVKDIGDKVLTLPSGPGRVTIFSKINRCPGLEILIADAISEEKVFPVV